MANYPVRYEVTFTDVNGDTAKASVEDVLTGDTTTLATLASNLATLAGDLQACSNAKVTATTVAVTTVKAQISSATAPPPANATYPSVTDGCKLNFANSAGARRSITIPAPLLSDFKTGTNTANPDDGNMVVLIGFIEGLNELLGSSNLYEGGVKVGRHSRRRVSRKSL